MIPVRPAGCDEVLGVRCVQTLAEIDRPIDLIDVFRRAELTPPHAEEAVQVGAGALWLQLGIVSAESRRIADFAAHGRKSLRLVRRRRTARQGPVLASIGDRMPAAMAVVAGLSELVGVLLLAIGLLTPLASLLIATVMLNAIATVAFPKEFLGGYEFEFTLLTVAVALAATGPGESSIDDAIGWADNISGIAWGSLVLASAIVVSPITTTNGRARADLDEIPG